MFVFNNCHSQLDWESSGQIVWIPAVAGMTVKLVCFSSCIRVKYTHYAIIHRRPKYFVFNRGFNSAKGNFFFLFYLRGQNDTGGKYGRVFFCH